MLRIRLRREIESGTPWRAADALEVLTSIDMPAWAAFVALIAECPVIHGGLIASIDRRVHSVDPNAFDFISGPDHIRLIDRLWWPCRDSVLPDSFNYKSYLSVICLAFTL